MHRQLVTLASLSEQEYNAIMDGPPLFDTYYPYSRGEQQQQHAGAGAGARVAIAANFPVPTLVSQNKTYEATPWRATQCAACTSELDCRMKNEYCASDGCCRVGECETATDCENHNALEHFYAIHNFDSLGSNINPMNPQNDLNVVRKLCEVNPDCVGYNSYGLLKHSISEPSLWTAAPPLEGLVPWTLYIKKSATQGKKPKVKLPHGMKQLCVRPHPPPGLFAMPTGRCTQCIGCSTDSDCPDSTICSARDGCCVNNPCYTATPEDGRWVDGHYSREPQCNCPGGEPYCCLSDPGNPSSAFCSTTPCNLQDKVRACAYICEDEKRQFDAVVCKANERCCGSRDGPPVCCGKAAGCDTTSEDNACGSGTELIECPPPPNTPFMSVYCSADELCCNSANAPPMCCSDRALGCFADTNANGCNYSDLRSQ